MKRLIFVVFLIPVLAGCGESPVSIAEQRVILDEFRNSMWDGCGHYYGEGILEDGPFQGRSYLECRGQTSPGYSYRFLLVAHGQDPALAGHIFLDYRLGDRIGFIGLTEPLFKTAGLNAEKDIDQGRKDILSLTIMNPPYDMFYSRGDFEQFTMKIANNRPRYGRATVHLDLERDP